MTNYIKCATDSCNIKIHVSVVTKWDAKCPKCRGVELNYSAPVPGRKAPAAAPKLKAGYVLCVTSGCKVQLHENYVAQAPENATCPKCRNISYQRPVKKVEEICPTCGTESDSLSHVYRASGTQMTKQPVCPDCVIDLVALDRDVMTRDRF